MENPQEPTTPQPEREAVPPPLPHRIEYASPTAKVKRPRNGPLPAWERVAVSALFCAVFCGIFSCFCPFEAINYLYLPMAYFLAAVIPPQNNDTLIFELARALTGFFLGALGALLFPLIERRRNQR